ncbi:ATP-grasp domain-containing protein [Micromonospora sp. BQ11]|uniref:ATP-grasp domain-containing protein n=1 Tax=Micromonospora sp. BQ11 TaxID=3452212 RepID=UPI003F8B4156
MTPGVVAVVETQLSNFGLTPLRAAHDLGYQTMLLSNDPDRYRVVALADEVFDRHVDLIATADTNSTDAVVEALTPLHVQGRLRGVMTVTDYNLPLVADVAAYFGLPGLDPRAARTCRDKLLMRQALAAAGVAVPRFRNAVDLTDALDAAATFGYPCVVKPMTESASIGVSLCRDADQVRAAFETIASVPVNFRGQPRRPGALVEEYLVGYEVSVESIQDGGRRDVIGVTDKTLSPHPYFVETGDMFPSMLSDSVKAAVVDTATRALDAVGHDFGAAHVEIRVTADGPRVVEVNGRMGGAELPQMIYEATGIDQQRELVRLHCGERADLTRTRARAAVSRCFVASTPGVFRGLTGLDLARRIPADIHLDIEVRPGDTVGPAESNLDILGCLIAVADTVGDAVRSAEAAMNQVRIDLDELG